MTFDEQFPGLNGKYRTQMLAIGQLGDTMIINKRHIEKNCLDKQRVKAAVFDLPDDEKKAIYERLGLDEVQR